MSSAQETFLWIGFAGMTLGAVAIGLIGKRAQHEDKHHAVASMFVCIIAAVSYFAMANGQGIIDVDGRSVYIARYADWLFTTPLLLVGLMMVGLPQLRSGDDDSRARTSLLAGVIGADALMIVTGALAALSTDDTVRYTWYAISCGAFLAVLALLYGPVREIAKRQSGSTPALFGTLLSMLTVLWCIYPVLWLLGTEGTGTIGLSGEILVFTVIDVTAKAGFGLLLVSRVAALSQSKSGARSSRPIEASAA